MSKKYWLMKAEPDSRVVKGKDVKFSVDDLESVGTTAWEGVRNHEAKNLMKSMKIGDKVAFYHSNCKNPGIAGFAEVSKEAYPDYTAWDSSHPYYDAKTDKDDPKWYMVDVTFSSRAKNFVPLSFMKRIASLPDSNELPEDISYIGANGVKAIKGMALVNRGRLSVQPVEEETYDVICMLADKGGWEDDAKDASTSKESTKPAGGKKRGRPSKKSKAQPKEKEEGEGVDEADDQDVNENIEDEENKVESPKRGKRKSVGDAEQTPTRKSARTKKE